MSPFDRSGGQWGLCHIHFSKGGNAEGEIRKVLLKLSKRKRIRKQTRNTSTYLWVNANISIVAVAVKRRMHRARRENDHIPGVDRDKDTSGLIVLAAADSQGRRALENAVALMRVGVKMGCCDMAPCALQPTTTEVSKEKTKQQTPNNMHASKRQQHTYPALPLVCLQKRLHRLLGARARKHAAIKQHRQGTIRGMHRRAKVELLDGVCDARHDCRVISRFKVQPGEVVITASES